MWYVFQLTVFFGCLTFFIENDLYKGYGLAPIAISIAASFLATVALSGLLRRQ